jgi:hypothetical protein
MNIVDKDITLKPNDCIECGEDTSFGSGRFVNRIPADDNYMCYECLDEIEKEIEENEDE